LRGMWLCAACLSDLPVWVAPWCERCGIPHRSGACRCDVYDEVFSALRSIGSHRTWIQASVHLLKYRDEPARAAFLGRYLAEAIGDLPAIDVVTPIPLHENRLRERGYNQARLLADALAFETGLPVDDALVRVLDTAHQVGLDADARRTNMEAAFASRPGSDVARLHVLLVDDVVTTGATAASAARTLRDAGAARVSLVTVARA